MSNEEVPKEILTSLSHLTKFLSRPKTKNDGLENSDDGMIDVKKVSLFNDFRMKFFISDSHKIPKSSSPTPVLDEHIFENDYYDEEESEVGFDDYQTENKEDNNFKFSFRSQQVQPPLVKISETSTEPPQKLDTSTVYVDTPFRLEFDPVSGLFSTIKN